jgi:hypothetical protein
VALNGEETDLATGIVDLPGDSLSGREPAGARRGKVDDRDPLHIFFLDAVSPFYVSALEAFNKNSTASALSMIPASAPSCWAQELRLRRTTKRPFGLLLGRGFIGETIEEARPPAMIYCMNHP